MIGQQKGHACKITHPDSVLVGSRVILVMPQHFDCSLHAPKVFCCSECCYQRVTQESNHDQSAH